jgi:hypothetical protein
VPIQRLDDGVTLWSGGPVPKGADGVTIGSWIIVRKGAEKSAYLLAHERVHVRQWAEFGHIGFLARYVGSYLRWRLRGYDHDSSYRRIPFEIEADWIARRQLQLDDPHPSKSHHHDHR